MPYCANSKSYVMSVLGSGRFVLNSLRKCTSLVARSFTIKFHVMNMAEGLGH